MIRTIKRLIATDNNEYREYREIACLSTDTKPTDGLITGSILTEVDTGNVFFYDETAEASDPWIEQFSFQA